MNPHLRNSEGLELSEACEDCVGPSRGPVVQAVVDSKTQPRRASPIPAVFKPVAVTIS